MKPFRRTKHTVRVDVRALEGFLREFDPAWGFLLMELVAIALDGIDDDAFAVAGLCREDVERLEEAGMSLADFATASYYSPFGRPEVSIDASTGMLTLLRRRQSRRREPSMREQRPLRLSSFRRRHARN